MRILQINKFFYRRGGSESYFFDLINLLRSHGHEIINFSMKHPQNEPSPYSDFFVDEINFDKRESFLKDIKKFFHSLHSVEAKKKLEQLIKKTKPEVAHLHNISHHLSPSILSVLKKYKIPVIQTLHDYQLMCPNFKMFTEGAVCERCKKYRYWNAFSHKCVHDSRLEGLAECLEMYFHKACQIYENSVYCFVTPSDFLRKKIEVWGGGGKAKVVPIPHFIDVSAYKPKYEPGNYAVYFGRLAEEKGLLPLIQAVAGTEIKLKIVGDGPEKEKLLALKEKTEADVDFVGYKSGEELHDLIRNSRLVLLPAVWYENYPMSLLEAGALGKPAIGSNLGGIPEIIHDGENGFLAIAGDAEDLRKKILQLWSDSDLCQRMGRRAREMVIEKNSPKEHYQKIIGLYKTSNKNN